MNIQLLRRGYLMIENIKELEELIQVIKRNGVKSFSDVSTGIAFEFFSEEKKENNDLDFANDSVKEKQKDCYFGGVSKEDREYIQ